jgi:hypothetical protein
MTLSRRIQQKIPVLDFIPLLHYVAIGAERTEGTDPSRTPLLALRGLKYVYFIAVSLYCAVTYYRTSLLIKLLFQRTFYSTNHGDPQIYSVQMEVLEND